MPIAANTIQKTVSDSSPVPFIDNSMPSDTVPGGLPGCPSWCRFHETDPGPVAHGQELAHKAILRCGDVIVGISLDIEPQVPEGFETIVWLCNMEAVIGDDVACLARVMDLADELIGHATILP